MNKKKNKSTNTIKKIKDALEKLIIIASMDNGPIKKRQYRQNDL